MRLCTKLKVSIEKKGAVRKLFAKEKIIFRPGYFLWSERTGRRILSHSLPLVLGNVDGPCDR